MRGRGAGRIVVPGIRAGTGGSSSGGAPTLPSNATVGAPASKMIDWGNNLWAFISGATNTTWVSRGHQGYKIAVGFLPSRGGGQRFVPSDSSALGANYQTQQYQESAGMNYAAQAQSVGMEDYVGWYFRTASQSTSAPPFTDWWDATIKASVLSESTVWVKAFSQQYLGLTGMALDTETPSWDDTGYTGNTHTTTQNHGQVRQWGYDLGLSWWTEFPSMRLLIYSASLPAGWQNKVQQVVNAGAYPRTSVMYQDLVQGFFEGMKDAGGTGQIIMAESAFYRTAAQITSNGSAKQASAYKINSQGTRAWCATNWPQTTWDFAADKLRLVGFTWRTTDGTTYYDATAPTAASWSTQLLDARSGSEGTRRVEYNYSGCAPSITEYAGATEISGAQAAASTTPISTTGPTVVTAAVANAATDTITIQVRDPYGVACVRVYTGSGFSNANPEAKYLGSMKMTWNENSGSYTVLYTDDYQDCTFGTPINSGDWFVLGIFGIRADSFKGLTGETTWVRVQAP